MTPYIHKVQYYETDKMGITHHSNYIRWMEEARVDYLEQIGWAYDRLEQEGIMSPVLSVECRYKESTTYPDEIEINVMLLLLVLQLVLQLVLLLQLKKKTNLMSF